MSTDSSKKPHLHISWLGVLLSVFMGYVALFGSQIIVVNLLSIYPLILGWNVNHINNWLNNSILAMFISTALSETLAVAIVYWFLKIRKVNWRTIGLRKPKWLDPIFGLMGLPAYFVIYFLLLDVITKIAPNLNTTEKQQLGGFTNGNVHGVFELVATFISLVILPPIAEEIIFRGLIFTNLRKKMSLWMSAIVTSLLFAAPHLLEGGSGGLLYIAAIDTFSLSLVLVYLREKTGGLYAGMTLHALKNLIAFIALFALHVS